MVVLSCLPGKRWASMERTRDRGTRLPACAVSTPWPDRGGQGVETAQAGSLVPLSRVLSMLAQRFPGRQLNTTMGQAGGRPAYLVQWQLTNGRIVVFTIDAQTGQVVGQ